MGKPIKNFLQTPEGLLLISDGFNAVKKYDGLVATCPDAGVPAPSTNVSLATTGTGDILGVIYAYQRWLDADGNFGNLSPVSSALTISGSTGSITAATNASPIQITSASHGLVTTDKVYITGVVGNAGANGIWTVTQVDVNNFTLDNSRGTGDYLTGGTWYEGTGQIDYTSVDAPTDSRVTKRQILRTKHGDANALYVDVETTDLVSESFNSTTLDSALTSPLYAVSISGEDLLKNRYAEAPDWRPFLAHNNGRVVGAGDPVYDTGAVSVTNGSASVTGIGTDWTTDMAGRLFYVKGATVPYEISSVGSATSITLTANYGGSTDAYALYGISGRASSDSDTKDDARRKVNWSESLLPEAWNRTLTLQLPEDSFSGSVTAAISHNRFVWVCTENRIFKFYYQNDPKFDGYLSFGPQRGCINQRTWTIADDYIWMMDRQGFYQFSGNDLRHVSAPIQDIFDPESDSKWKINWKYSRYFHAIHDPENETVKFFVSMTGRYPRHAICFQYRHKRFWIEEYPLGITSSTLGLLPSGRRQVFLGAEYRTILAMNHGNADGPKEGSGTVRGTATSATLTSITDTSATFPASDVVNSQVHIVDGTGRGQERRIVSVSGTTLNVAHPWTKLPDTTSVYQIAGVKWSYKTGHMRFTDVDVEQTRRWELIFEPNSNAARLDVLRYMNRSATAENEGYTRSQANGNGVGCTDGEPYNEVDITKDTGFVTKIVDATRETRADGNRHVQFELVGVTNEERQIVRQLSIHGVRK